jgi:hypothetical protein
MHKAFGKSMYSTLIKCRQDVGLSKICDVFILIFGQENRIDGRGGGGIRCADHATPSIRKKLALTSSTSGGRSVGIV